MALASLIVYPQLSDIQRAFPDVDPALVNHDIAYPAMLRFLPVGFVGLMVGGLIAANSSTILTHLNWGASYLVHDFYQRFVRRGASEKHYIFVGRLTTVLLFAASALLTTVLDSAKDNFDLMLQVGAGTGLLYLVRWFWWRITAWCEVVAMISSFAISVALFILHKTGALHLSTHVQLLLTVAFTTICWLLTAYLGPQTDRKTLVEFYRRVHPAGPGWEPIRSEAGVSDALHRATASEVPLALLGWTLGCAMIWSSLFAVGNFCYGRTGMALLLTAVFVVTGLGSVWVIKRLWQPAPNE